MKWVSVALAIEWHAWGECVVQLLNMSHNSGAQEVAGAEYFGCRRPIYGHHPAALGKHVVRQI